MWKHHSPYVEHSQPNISDQGLFIKASAASFTPSQTRASQELTLNFTLKKLVESFYIIFLMRSKPDQRTTECRLLLSHSSRKPTMQPVGKNEDACMLREAANELGRKVQSDEPLPRPPCVSNPRTPHAIVLLLSGGCLDAVKSCFSKKKCMCLNSL